MNPANGISSSTGFIGADQDQESSNPVGSYRDAFGILLEYLSRDWTEKVAEKLGLVGHLEPTIIDFIDRIILTPS